MPMTHKNTAQKIHSISFIIILLLIGILPLFFLPSTVAGIVAIKGVLLYGAVLTAFSLWVIGFFLEGRIEIIRHRIMIALVAWGGLSLINALTSRVLAVSLWGRGFAVDSFAFTAVGILAFVLIASFAAERARLLRMFFALFFGSLCTVLFQILFYVTYKTSFVSRYFSGIAQQGTLVGSWTDFAYLTVMVFMMGLLCIEVLRPKAFLKISAISAVVLSLFVLIFLNFTTAWVLTILGALIVFVYKSSIDRVVVKTTKKKGEDSIEPVQKTASFPVYAFISLLIALFFYLSANSVGAALANYANLTFSNIRPSFSTSVHVARATVTHDPLFGAGAGRYTEMWNLYRPSDVNKTIFWNKSFDTGYSTALSVITTNGVLPFIALVTVMVYIVIISIKTIQVAPRDNVMRFVVVMTAVMVGGSIALFFAETPGLVLVTIGFFFMAFMVGIAIQSGVISLQSFDYLKDPRASFFTILLLVLIAMVGFSATYFTGNRFASIVYYNRALLASDSAIAQSRIDRALSLSQNDIYWRTRAVLFTNQFSSAAAGANPDKALLQSYFSQAEQSARAATTWDATNANNWLTVSQVYQLVASSNATEAITNGKKAAEEALQRNPNNPVIFINQAQFALIQQDTQGALEFIKKALAIKPDYLDAFIMKGQIAKNAGDAQGLKNELLAYVQTAPYDEQGYVVLSQAAAEAKEYQLALSAIVQAARLQPNNPNYYAQYITLLYLSGNKTQAVQELKNFKTVFPGIGGVDEQIKKIESESVAAPTAQTTAPATASSAKQATKKKR